MTPKSIYLRSFSFLSLALPASADVIYSNLQNITIPATYDGVYLNVETGAWNTDMFAPVAGWDINPYFGGSVLFNSPDFQPVRSGTGNLDAVLNLSAGTTVGSGSIFSTFLQGPGGINPGGPGYGGSQTHMGNGTGQFPSGTEGYFGFRLNGTNYGSMRVVFTNNTSGAVIKDWAYDTSGASVQAGAIKQVGQDIILSTGFTLASTSALVNSGGATNLVKNGSGTNILKSTSTYTGTTGITAGTLAVNGSGSINATSSISVSAGARLIYNSSTALTVGPTLNGNTIADRAVLGGTGTIDSAVILNDVGDTLSPGAGPGAGIQNFTPAQTWSSFSYDWEIKNFTGTTAGAAFDQIGLGSTLNLSGGSGSYILNVLGLTAGDLSGLVPNFDEIDRSWNILTSTSTITGFNAANWTINTTGFTDTFTGNWALAQSGNNLVLSYTAVPEFNVAALIGGFGVLALLRRRR